MSFEITVIFAFALTGIFLLTLIMIYSLIVVFRILATGTMFDQKVSRLFINRVYFLTNKPLRTAIRISSVDLYNHRVSGTLIVVLPSGSIFKSVTQLPDWHRFTVTYQKGQKFFSPTWYFDHDRADRLDGYWKVDPEDVEIML